MLFPDTNISYSLAPEIEVAAVPYFPVVGVDVSRYQGVIDWGKMKERIQFAWIQIGYGNNELDSQGKRNCDECEKRDIPYGVYWVPKPSKDWRKHVASFRAVLRGQLPPWYDIERNEGLGKAAMGEWMYKFVANFEDETGQTGIVYTRANWWNTYMPRCDWAKQHELAVAQYNPYIATPSDLPDDWDEIHNPKPWTFWQWSADGNGLGRTYGCQCDDIDLDRYNGTVAQFNARYGTHILPLEDPTPPTPEPEPEPEPDLPPEIKPVKLVKVLAGRGLNVRSLPTVAGLDIGDLIYGDKLPVVEKWGDWLRIEGWIHGGYTRDV